MTTDTTTPAARRVAHRRVGAAATAAFLALLALGALHRTADADTSTPTPTPTPKTTRQATPSTPSRPNGGGAAPGEPSTPGAGGGRFWHHRGDGSVPDRSVPDDGSVPDPSGSGVAPSAPAAPSAGDRLDGSTT